MDDWTEQAGIGEQPAPQEPGGSGRRKPEDGDHCI